MPTPGAGFDLCDGRVRLAPRTPTRKEREMSVLVTMKVQGDTDQFRRFVATEGDRLRELAQSARDAGAIHHRFGVGDGFVVVVDEWDSAESFQGFISSDVIVAVIGEMGGQGEPVVDITEAVDSPDQF